MKPVLVQAALCCGPSPHLPHHNLMTSAPPLHRPRRCAGGGRGSACTGAASYCCCSCCCYCCYCCCLCCCHRRCVGSWFWWPPCPRRTSSWCTSLSSSWPTWPRPSPPARGWPGPRRVCRTSAGTPGPPSPRLATARSCSESGGCGKNENEIGDNYSVIARYTDLHIHLDVIRLPELSSSTGHSKYPYTSNTLKGTQNPFLSRLSASKYYFVISFYSYSYSIFFLSPFGNLSGSAKSPSIQSKKREKARW